MKYHKRFRKLKRNNNAFSLVELLAVVVILGILASIGVGVVSNLIDKAEQDKIDSQKNTVTMSAQTYMQNNKNLVPKIIGESSIIKVSDLRKTNYLTEDIKNEKGESCMEKSYVRVYKLSNTEYTYTTFLYCGNEEVPADEVVPSPVITAKFSDSSGIIKDDLLNNVSDAYLYIEINAATADEITSYKSQGTQIVIDGYTFKIFVYKGTQKVEAYNSGSLSGGKEEKIVINKKLKDYIDVTGVTEVSIEVTAINTLGGITNSNTTVGEYDDKEESTIYDDNVKPKCIKPDSPYEEGDWLNKSEYNISKEQRKLTVGCDDGTGSGCIRNYFTQSWPNDDDKKGAEYVYVEVKDNAGNVSEHNDDCKFRVNVDIETPEATVTAYVGKNSTSNNSETLASKISGSNILKKTVKAYDIVPTAKIEHTEEYYDKLTGYNTSIKWMNDEKFPYGVIYKVDIKDNIRLDKWTWQTNAGYINSEKASDYLKVSGNNPEATNGSVTQDAAHGKTEFHGSTKDTIYVRFLTEGMRYGVLTIYDKAGNSIKINIAANLDRTAPPVPNSLDAYVFNKVRTGGTAPSTTSYSFSTWTNRYVRVQTSAGQNRDNLTNNVTLSGFWQYYYYASHGGSRVGTPDYNTYSSGVGYYDFKGTANQVDGVNTIKFRGCDKANNCSDWGASKEAWIDITFPVCSVEKVLNGTESNYGWLGYGETAVVRANCSDSTSGCTKASIAKLYNTPINTSVAGAVDKGNGGSFTDAAGNKVDCPANQTVKIDYSYPTCTVSGGSSVWTNKSRTVTGTCNDTGGSGCRGNISHTYDYDIKTTTGGAAGDNKGGSVKDKADNETKCPANQTVKVDRTKPYHTLSHSPGDYYSNDGIRVAVSCHDDLSGLSDSHANPTRTYGSRSPEDDFRIADCCEDNAGNVKCENFLYDVYYFSRHKTCGVEQYKQCRTSGCGIERYKSCRASACGVASYKSCKNSACGSVVDYWECRRGVDGNGGILYTCNPKCGNCPNGQWHPHTGYGTCRTAGCGVESYNSCRTSACGVELYYSCRHEQCGVELYKECWHL